MIKTQELFDEAVSLPVETRAQLVDKLLRSLHPAQKEIDELWAAEAEVLRLRELKQETGLMKLIDIHNIADPDSIGDCLQIMGNNSSNRHSG